MLKMKYGMTQLETKKNPHFKKAWIPFCEVRGGFEPP